MNYSASCKGTHKFVIGFLGVLIFFLVVGSAFLLGKVRGAEKRLVSEGETQEAAREAFFFEGYDKGYQSAVVDAYLGKPLYMIEEGDERGGEALWKKVELDEANIRKLSESAQISEEGPEKGD